ncbi:hypothetical protein F4860DRAFT_463272 [Xylaria cubensis]|nr:hypothetical protein F4860DRAFT_463272 [Xylaria cubensis]
MDSRPPSTIQFMIELAKMQRDLQSNLNNMFSELNSRLDELESKVATKICIPCPVDRCLKSFRTNGHRNRHIRNSAKKSHKDTLRKEHEKAAKDMNLIPDEDLSSDNDTDMGDNVHIEPQLTALLGNPDNSPLEIRAGFEPPLAEYSHDSHFPLRFWQPMPFYQNPNINDSVPTNYSNGGVDQVENQLGHQEFQREWDFESELLAHYQWLELLRQEIPGSGSDGEADDANQQWGMHGNEA